jgi:TRAP-type C4-dicarboxylate transport system substrate-binding protein
VRSLVTATGAAAFLVLFAGGDTTAQQAKDTATLRVVTAFATKSDWERGYWLFADKVEKLSNGRIKLHYIGGPEAVPPFQQIEAVRTGVVDLATNAGSYFSSVIPEGDAMKLSELTPWEERDNGAYEAMRAILAAKGRVHYLGRYHTPGVQFNFYTKDRIASTKDFKDRRLRISPLYRAFALALGVVPVTLPHAEIYTALERGLVEGLGAGNVGIYEQGHHKFVRYVVEPGFYGNDQVILVNLDAWNRLSDEHKRILTEAMKQTERESAELIKRQAAEERRKLEQAGITAVTLSDADQYLRLAKEMAWQEVVKVAPENGPKLMKLLTK